MGNGMPQKHRNRKFAGLALAATVGVFLAIAGGMSATYAADDDENMLPDEKFFRSFMRYLGFRNGQEAGLDARERAPLVVPPTRDLPPPATTGSITANNPAWPVDADEVKRAADKKARAQRKAYNPDTDQNPLMPSQLAQRSDKPGVKTSDGPDRSPELTPSQLGYTGGLWNSVTGIFSKDKQMETAKFLREPARDALTDPPTGYRTPSPDQPYGVNAGYDKGKAKVMQDHQTETVHR
jgi:hypothetical protein